MLTHPGFGLCLMVLCFFTTGLAWTVRLYRAEFDDCSDLLLVLWHSLDGSQRYEIGWLHHPCDSRRRQHFDLFRYCTFQLAL